MEQSAFFSSKVVSVLGARCCVVPIPVLKRICLREPRASRMQGLSLQNKTPNTSQEQRQDRQAVREQERKKSL